MIRTHAGALGILGFGTRAAPSEFRIRISTISTPRRSHQMNLGTVLVIVLILLLIGAIPTWPYSAGWGYYPSGGVGVLLLIIIVLLLTGRI
jgi:hypothetical protein